MSSSGHIFNRIFLQQFFTYIQRNKIEMATSENVSALSTFLVVFMVPCVDTSLRMSCYLFQLKFLYPYYLSLLYHLDDSVMH
jgi:hypothetical protein